MKRPGSFYPPKEGVAHTTASSFMLENFPVFWGALLPNVELAGNLGEAQCITISVTLTTTVPAE